MTVQTAGGGVQEKKLNAQTSMKSRSRSVTVNGSGQGASWRMYEVPFVFQKEMHRLVIVDDDNAESDTGKWSLYLFFVLKQSQQ